MVARIEAASPTEITGTVGTSATPAPIVRAVDDGGRPLAGVGISFSASDDGTVARPTIETDTLGLATVDDWTLGPASGHQLLVARFGQLIPVKFSATATAGPATLMARSSGEGQFASRAPKLPLPLVVRVTDAFGNPVEGASVIFEVVAGDGSIEGDSAETDSAGLAGSGSWTLGTDGGLQQVAARSGSMEVVFSAVAFSPPAGLEGRIAFVSTRDGNAEIYAVDADGSDLARLTADGSGDFAPAWSPDGSRIAFSSDREGTGDVFLMAPDGSNVTRRTEGLGVLEALAWSPDASAIAFSVGVDGDGQAYKVHIATASDVDGRITLLTDDPGYNAQPSWSPDGTQIAFVSDRDAYDFVYNIYTMNTDGTGLKLRTEGLVFWPNLAYYQHPAWSPDGSMIAFVYASQLRGRDFRFTLAVMSPTGTFIKDLAWAGDIWGFGSDPGSLAWSPDGDVIAYTFVDCDLATGGGCTGARSVKYVSLDGSRQGEIVRDAANPSWRR